MKKIDGRFAERAEQKLKGKTLGEWRRYWLPDLGSNQGPAD
jgi:hypothetical protein